MLTALAGDPVKLDRVGVSAVGVVYTRAPGTGCSGGVLWRVSVSYVSKNPLLSPTPHLPSDKYIPVLRGDGFAGSRSKKLFESPHTWHASDWPPLLAGLVIYVGRGGQEYMRGCHSGW